MQTPESAVGLNRRQWVSRMGGGLGAVALTQSLARSLQAADGSGGVLDQPHHRPRAKRVIQLFMNGGPFGGDFFDPKPLVAKHAGQRPEAVQLRTERRTAGLLPSPFQFAPAGECGTPVSELLPNFSRLMDDVCVIRSAYTDNPNHGPALLLMNNGTILPTRPSMGSWLSYGLGSENENLPSYVVLCPGRPVRFSILWTSAFLPGKHQGAYINHSNTDPRKLIPYVSNPRWNATQQQSQLELLQRLNRGHASARTGDAQLEARIHAMETAYQMQFTATEAFDVRREPTRVREAYGKGRFADGCLLARRLAERGVRFTQVYFGNGQPWDTHQKHHDTVRSLAKQIDQPMAALLADLKQRGMLEDTLVVWGGEFGRTPTSENGTGRDHNHYGFSMWLAGGGVRGGTTYGATDDFGFRAVENRVHIHDLHATILHLLGVDHERLTYRYAGRDFRLTDVHGRVIRDVIA